MPAPTLSIRQISWLMLACAPVAAPAVAAPLYGASVLAASGAYNVPGPTYNPSVRQNTATEVLFVTSSAADSASRASAYARGYSSAGALGAEAYASAVVNNDDLTIPNNACRCQSSGSGAFASVFYDDSAFINVPGVAPGTIGTMQYTLSVSGQLRSAAIGGSGDSSALWSVIARVAGNDFTASKTFYDTPTAPLAVTGTGSEGLQYVTVQVPLNQVFAVSLSIYTQANASATGILQGAVSQSSAEFLNTLTWTGIDWLKIGDTIVTDFTALSPDSGFDFRRGYVKAQPESTVPEPATAGLMMIALATAGATRLRRRRSPPAHR